ncbi:MAG: carboxypeptidase regulatory-like domain-containing protein [Bryobacteraceae bacterium]
MSVNLKTLAVSAAGFLLLASSAFAQTSALEGIVKGPDGAPIKDAVVKMERKDIKGNYTVKTDKKGHYGHYGLPLGTYKVSVEVGGQMKDSVDNVRTKLGDPTAINFDLHEQKEKQEALAKAAETGTLTKEQARDMTPEAKAAFEKANKARAAEMSKNKELNDAFNNGKTALENKQYDAAVENLKKASDMDPKQNVVWAQLAEAYMGQASTKTGADAEPIRQQGLDAYKKAIEIKPDEAAYYNNYALALAKDKKIPEAEEALTKAAQIDPKGAGRYYYNLGAVLVNTNQLEPAGVAFKKAIELDPDYADAQYQYGVYLISKAQVAADGKVTPVPGTQEALEKYLQLKPNGPFAESAKGMLSTMDSKVATKYVNPDAKPEPAKKGRKK